MLRLAKESDIDLVVRLCREFFQQTQYGRIPLDDSSIRELCLTFLRPNNPDRVCILWDSGPHYGIIAGQLSAIPFIQRKVATECLWYLDTDIRGGRGGGDLLDAFEHWASLVGADLIQMMCMPDQTGKLLDRYYKKRGYSLTELTYTKELNNGSL